MCEFAFLGRLLAFCETQSDWKQPNTGASGWSSSRFDVGGPIWQLWLSNIATLTVRSLAISSKQPLMFLGGRLGVSTWVVQFWQLWLSNIAALAVRSPATSSESSCVVFNCVKYLIDSVSAICSV